MGQELPTDFEASVCAHLGCDLTPDVHAYFVAWQHAEASHAANNPFDTELPWGLWTDYNTAGVKNYATVSDGVNATVNTLLNGFYPDIVAAIRAGTDAMVMADALAASPWGTGEGAKDYLLATGYKPSGQGGGDDEVTETQIAEIVQKVTASVTAAFELWLRQEYAPNDELFNRIVQAVQKGAK